MKALSNYFYIAIFVFAEFIMISNFMRGQTMVIVSPSSTTLQPLFMDTINVKVSDVKNLFAASVTLTFDSTILRFCNVIGGSFLTNNNTNSIFLGVVQRPQLPMAPNKITVDQAIPSGGTVSGSGILFAVVFKALRDGSSPITIVSSDLRNGLNTTISAQIISAQVDVNIAPEPVQLLSPQNGSIIDTSLIAKLIWSKSIDIDTGDVVRYEVHIASAFSNINLSNLSDTVTTLTRNMLEENTEYTWYVDATDGIDTISSNQIFKFKTPMIRQNNRFSKIFKVEQNYPNPFNSSTNICFSVPTATQVTVTIFDMLGRQIRQLIKNNVSADYYTIVWDGNNSYGVAAGSGVYMYVVAAGRYNESKKMVLLK